MADQLTPRMREALTAANDGHLMRYELSYERPAFARGRRVNEGTIDALLRRRAIRLGAALPGNHRQWEITDKGRELLQHPEVRRNG